MNFLGNTSIDFDDSTKIDRRSGRDRRLPRGTSQDLYDAEKEHDLDIALRCAAIDMAYQFLTTFNYRNALRAEHYRWIRLTAMDHIQEIVSGYSHVGPAHDLLAEYFFAACRKIRVATFGPI